jgi:hypothetical protein
LVFVNRFLAVLLVLLALVLPSLGRDYGSYASKAISIWAAGETTIPSPDGTKAIVIRAPKTKDSDETHLVVVNVNGKEFPTKIGAWVNAEALWSPDSRAFFVNYSDGGNIGTYHLKVFYVSKAGLRVVEPIPNGRRLFAPWCFSSEYPPVAGIRWMAKDSSRILLAVEVPPHSSCASMGTFRAYEIAASDGKVLRRFGQRETKEKFADALGHELKEADDSCVEKPESCVPTGLKKHS